MAKQWWVQEELDLGVAPRINREWWMARGSGPESVRQALGRGDLIEVGVLPKGSFGVMRPSETSSIEIQSDDTWEITDGFGHIIGELVDATIDLEKSRETTGDSVRSLVTGLDDEECIESAWGVRGCTCKFHYRPPS